MDNGKISVRYARALLSNAVERQCETEVYRQLCQLTANYSLAIQAFNEALSNPMSGDTEKIELLRTAIGEPVQLDPVPESGETAEWLNGQTQRIQAAVGGLSARVASC